MIGLGVSSNCEHELKLSPRREQPVMPMRYTFGTRRLVTADGIISREAEAHGHDRNRLFIIENVLFHGEPGP